MAVQFKTPTSGNFFRPALGQYIGEFKEHQDGPPSTYLDEQGNPKPTVRWVWKLYDFNTNQPVLNQEGQHAEGDGLSSVSTGPKSKAAGWFQAHLGRPLKPGENMEQVVQQIVGKRVMLLYTPDTDGGTRLSSVLPYQG